MDSIRRPEPKKETGKQVEDLYASLHEIGSVRSRSSEATAGSQASQTSNGIEKPAKRFSWQWPAVGTVVLVCAGLVAVVYTSYRSDRSYRSDKADTTDRSDMTDKGDESGEITSRSGGESGISMFDAEAFYAVRTAEGQLYFARIKEAGPGHYLLGEVFYEQSRDGQATATPGKITLVKLGTEEYQPDDELFLSREKVKEIFPLSKTSAILREIKEYLGNQ